MIIGKVMRMLRSLYLLSMELWAFLVVHNDLRWKCASVQ
jgi:hypothetical protein